MAGKYVRGLLISFNPYVGCSSSTTKCRSFVDSSTMLFGEAWIGGLEHSAWLEMMMDEK
jgi:hypothetical protein